MVLISIVSYGNAHDVLACLRSLSRQSVNDYRVFICENAGPEAFEALAAATGEIVGDMVEETSADPAVRRQRRGRLAPGGAAVVLAQAKANLGFAGGVNVALRRVADDAGVRAVWLLNPDAQAEPQALAALIERAQATGADIVSSRLVRSDGRIQLYGGRWRRAFARGFNIGFMAGRDDPVDIERIEREMDYVNGASLFATRAYLEKAGPLDERYFLYCEDIEWCMRYEKVRLAYAHEAVVVHAHGTTIGSSADRKAASPLSAYLGERNRLIFTRRLFPRLYPLVICLSLLMILRYLADGAYGLFFVSLRGWWAGLIGEEGDPQGRAAPSPPRP